MHVLIEALGARVGGGITRLIGVVDALPRVAPQHQYSIMLSSSYQRKIVDRLSGIVNVIDVDARENNLLWRAWFQSFVLPGIAARIGADVVFASGEGAYLRAPVPLVMRSGNLLLFEKQHRRKGGLYSAVRRPFLRRSFSVASRIAFVSDTIRHAAIDAIGLEPGKTFVMHHGVGAAFGPREGESVDPYFLVVSSIAEHKGYDTLIEAWRTVGSSVSRLRIAGGVADPSAHERMVQRIRLLGLESRIELLGSVPYDGLPDLYAGARALLFPSEVESFGHPLVEAMASGVPVIASDLPVCREVCDDAALYFRARDAQGLARQVLRLDSEPETRRRLRNAGLARVKLFTWDAAAATLVAQLETVIEGKE